MSFNPVKFVNTLRQVDLRKKIPNSEFVYRIERMRTELKKRGLDVGFAFGNELRPGDTGWLTGYDPQVESAAVIIGSKKVFVLGGPEGKAYAEEMMEVGEYRCLTEFKIPDEDYPGYEFSNLRSLLKEASGDVEKIGVLTLGSILPCEIFDLLGDAGAEVADASDILLHWRYIKSETEQQMMRVAARITTYGMLALISSLEVGKRETQVAANSDYVIKQMGADRIGFTAIVCSGERASNVIGRASNKVIKKGELVVLGASARYAGLASAIGRTVVAGGRPGEAQKELIEHGTKALELSVEKLRYGAPAKEVDLTSRRYLRSKGLEPMYSEVHNIGWTECMEGFGAATQHADYNFPKNISLELDVGVFGRRYKNIPAKGLGFRIEDPYLINSKGKTERLTELPTRVYGMVPKK